MVLVLLHDVPQAISLYRQVISVCEEAAARQAAVSASVAATGDTGAADESDKAKMCYDEMSCFIKRCDVMLHHMMP